MTGSNIPTQQSSGTLVGCVAGCQSANALHPISQQQQCGFRVTSFSIHENPNNKADEVT
jgi:hypothetical protein